MKTRYLEEGYGPELSLTIASKEEKFRCYCAATVTAVAAVAATGVAAYGQYSQSKAQGEAADQSQSALDANKADTYGSRPDLPDYHDRIGTKEGLGQAVWNDFNESLPAIKNIASQVNSYGLRQRDKLAGGKFMSNIRQQGSNIESLLKGEIPDDVAGSINRVVAERLGGAFNPSTPGGFGGGISQTGSALARSLGTTSVALMDKGMTYAPQWEKLVDDFTYTPGKAIADAGTFLSAAQIQLRRDEDQYNSEASQALAEAGANPQVAGSVNDTLRLNTIGSQADANQSKALAGLITAGAGGATSLYNSFNKPKPSPFAGSTASAAPTAYAAG